MVIVYYDSEIQKLFEDVVRSIGLTRNRIRKVRTTAHRGKDAKEDKLAHIDILLEKAQLKCEHGAHMFLREGTCEADILEAKLGFEETLILSETEKMRLTEESNENPDPVSSMEKKEASTVSTSSNLGFIDIDDESDDGEAEDFILKLPPRFVIRTSRVMTIT